MDLTRAIRMNTKLTQYNGVKEWVLRNSVKNVPCMEKSRCSSLDSQLNNYF